MNRRDFLKFAAGASVLTASTPTIANNWRFKNVSQLDLRPRVLVLIELKGGNDSTNMVIPYSDPAYAVLRPKIHVPKKQVATLGPDYGLHPAMGELQSLWEKKELAIVNGIGTPVPSTQHYRARQRWDTASPDKLFTEGWGHTLGINIKDYKAYLSDGIVIGDQPGPLFGYTKDIRTLSHNIEEVLEEQEEYYLDFVDNRVALNQILQVRSDLVMEHRYRNHHRLKRSEAPKGFPDSAFGKNMQDVARMIVTDTYAPLIKLTLDGFDTHRDQPEQHAEKLKELADALMAFRVYLREHAMWRHTLVATYSEFGRRPEENAMGGTEHGSSASHLVMGDAVLGGNFYGAMPSLTNLFKNQQRIAVDYRQYLNAFFMHWFGTQSSRINYRNFPPVGFMDISDRRGPTMFSAEIEAPPG